MFPWTRITRWHALARLCESVAAQSCERAVQLFAKDLTQRSQDVLEVFRAQEKPTSDGELF